MSIVFVVLGLGGACAFYFWKTSPKAVEPAVAQASPSPSAAIPEVSPSPVAAILYPVPDEKKSASSVPSALSAQKLPQLDQSDASIQDWLLELFGKGSLDSLVNVTDLIRRIVVTVENATEPHASAVDVAVFIPARGKFLTSSKSGRLEINPGNYARYNPFVSLIEKVSTKKLVDAYIHFYPLIQAAYHDVNAHGYFNDRLVDGIDNLLAAPDVPDPVQLIQGGVFLKYADPKLEACSSGQKVLIRIGSVNAGLIKAKLKQLRNSLTRFTDAP